MDVVAWNTVLDAVYGPNRAAGTPVAFEVALLATPDQASELVGAGYVRPTLDNGNWLDADGAVKTTSVVLEFGTPTAAWVTARFVALIDPATDAVWNIVPATEPLTVTDAGPAVTTRVSIAAGGVFEG